MSARRSTGAAPTAAPAGMQVSHAERTALTLGPMTPEARTAPKPSAAPVGMMAPMFGAVSYARKVMMLKGLVFGIPEDKYAEAYAEAVDLITKEGITTICWDGDKLGYDVDQYPAPKAFTNLLVMLQHAMPWLEFIYFKREGKASELVFGTGAVELDKDVYESSKKRGKEVIQYLGPFPFLTATNTKIGKSTDAAPAKIPGMNYGVEFAGGMKWYELGLKGLEYIKQTLGVPSVTYMVFGLGGAVQRELEKVAEEPYKYPAGISQFEIKIIEVVRPPP